MITKLHSSTIVGLDMLPVEIEVDVASGLPSTQIVGLPDVAVRESRERIKAAIRNAGFKYPRSRVTINLAPAGVKKEGASFDLVIALGILAASHQIVPSEKGCLIFGELALNSAVRPVCGIFPILVQSSRNTHVTSAVIPRANMSEAMVRDTGLRIYAVKDLRESVDCIEGRGPVLSDSAASHLTADLKPVYDIDFSDIRGQFTAVRGAEVAAAAQHNILMVGPPGCGKTMIAKRLPTIMPDLTEQEMMEVLMIKSVTGNLRGRKITGRDLRRPFRSPHHTTTAPGLSGGGNRIKPGEVTLAHKGILYLDELAEFNGNVLDVLRQPLEQKSITVTRLNQSITYPADCMLVATMNPCRCGFFGDPAKPCVCSARQIRSYISRLSGPFMDRVDMTVQFSKIPYKDLRWAQSAEPSAVIKERVAAAVERQKQRFEGLAITLNSQMSLAHTEQFCRVSTACETLLSTAYKKHTMTARSLVSVLRLGRTIADLEESSEIKEEHLLEALYYKKSIWDEQ